MRVNFLPYLDKYEDSCMAVFESNVDVFFTQEERQEFLDWLRNSKRMAYYVGLVEGEVLCCGGLYKNKELNRYGYAWGMVRRDFHKKGLGKQLSDFRKDRLLEQEEQLPFELHTSQETYGFYARQGFEVQNIEENGFGKGLHKYTMLYHPSELTVIETDRLRIRKLIDNDAHHFLALNSDPKVVEFTGNDSFANHGEALAKIKEIQDEHYNARGYGRWAVIHKAEGEFMGWCGLKYRKQEGEIDLGYRFRRKFWKQGYGSEAASACLEYGHNDLGLEEIVATALIGNKGSIGVMKKIGMNFLRDFKWEGKDDAQYYVSTKH